MCNSCRRSSGSCISSHLLRPICPLLESLPLGRLVLNALCERIGPQYHMLENAEELHAHPMMCLEAHWFYFERVTSAMTARLATAGLLSDNAVVSLRAINKSNLAWL